MKGESDVAHAKRVKDYLLLLTDEQFTSFGYMIDPEDPEQTQFVMFYNQVLQMRVHLMTGNKHTFEGSCSKLCNIF